VVNGEEVEPVITVCVSVDGVGAIVVAVLDDLLDCCTRVDASEIDVML